MLMNSELKLPRMVASPNCHCYQIQVSSLYSHFLFQLETDSTLDPRTALRGRSGNRLSFQIRCLRPYPECSLERYDLDRIHVPHTSFGVGIVLDAFTDLILSHVLE